MRKPERSTLKRRARALAALALAINMLLFLWALLTAPSQSAGADVPRRHPRLESALRDLVMAHQGGDASAAGDFAARHGVTLIHGLVRVVVVGDEQAEPVALAQQIVALGGQVERAHGPWMQARLPVEALPALADTPGVRFVRRPWPPLPVTTSEGVAVTHADEWHGNDLTGQGARVGVLDVGFLGYNARITEGELPSDVITKSFVGGGSESDFWAQDPHGTACAEIVHDMAPDARLYLVNFGTEVEWANAVDWLLAQSVDAISFSAGWPVGGPGNGTGTLADKVSDVRSAGVLWVNAAGNSARRHWMGQFYDPDPYQPGSPRWHNFDGTDETNEITVTGESRLVIGLRWNDPWGSSDNDYDLVLFRDNGGTLEEVARSDNTQDGDDAPQELIDYYFPSAGVYHVTISKQAGALTRTLELFSYFHDLHYQTADSSLAVPSDSPGSLTVGATYWQDDALEAFSSHGPTRDGRTKPDLTAPDGVSISTEGWRDSGFYGTSASAPHVAGAAALALEALPTLTPGQLQSWLEDQALDLGTAGKDNAYGAGRLNLATTVRPGAALQGSTVTLAVCGVPFTSTATFQLAKPGYGNMLPTDVTWVSVSQLTGTVDLSGAAPGLWTLLISNTSLITQPDAFLVAVDQLYLPLAVQNASP